MQFPPNPIAELRHTDIPLSEYTLLCCSNLPGMLRSATFIILSFLITFLQLIQRLRPYHHRECSLRTLPCNSLHGCCEIAHLHRNL